MMMLRSLEASTEPALVLLDDEEENAPERTFFGPIEADVDPDALSIRDAYDCVSTRIIVVTTSTIDSLKGLNNALKVSARSPIEPTRFSIDAEVRITSRKLTIHPSNLLSMYDHEDLI
jgi:hypothetical protein